MKEFLLIVSVFVGLALLVEIVYLLLVFLVNKYYNPKPPRPNRIIVVHKHYYGRPDLDFDMGLKKVDRLKFGDEDE